MTVPRFQCLSCNALWRCRTHLSTPAGPLASRRSGRRPSIRPSTRSDPHTRRKALADAASGQSADMLLQALQGFGSHAPLDLPSRSDPEPEAEELAFCGARHRALGFVDVELQPSIEATHRLHDTLARSL